MPRIYLDNAATSFPKPDAVYAAMDRYNRELGVPLGRGAYAQAVEVQNTVQRCRTRAAELLGAEAPERIVFTFNATDSLNLALHGLLGPGDHAVTSVVEHNSILRPLRDLQQRCGIQVTYADCDEAGRVDPAGVRAALRPETKLVAVTHASNVTGTTQPIAEIGEIARRAGVLLLVDAAQTAGHLPIDLGRLPVDLLACAGHKGLLGPLGTGLLYVRPGVERRLRSLRQGGTGTRSEDDSQPETLPDKYESGNHNVPGLVGLEAGLGWLQATGVATVHARETERTGDLLDGLRSIDRIALFGPDQVEQRTGVVSLTLAGYEPQILATILDEHFGIQARAGLHCAPRIHGRLGTLPAGGTLRLSVGPFTTREHVDAAVRALREIAAG